MGLHIHNNEVEEKITQLTELLGPGTKKVQAINMAVTASIHKILSETPTIYNPVDEWYYTKFLPNKYPHTDLSVTEINELLGYDD